VAPFLLIFLRINCYASVLLSAKTKTPDRRPNLSSLWPCLTGWGHDRIGRALAGLASGSTTGVHCAQFTVIDVSTMTSFVCSDRQIPTLYNRRIELSKSLYLLVLVNLLHQACIAGFVKHLSLCTGHNSGWIMAYVLVFAHGKRLTEYCSLRETLNGNVATFNVDKWRHSDVIVIKLTAGTQHKIPYKTYIWIFHTLKITKIMLFRNLSMERPSYNQCIIKDQYRPTNNRRWITLLSELSKLELQKDNLCTI